MAVYVEIPEPDGTTAAIPDRRTRQYRTTRLRKLQAAVAAMLVRLLDAQIAGNTGRVELAGEGLAEAYTRLQDAKESYAETDRKRGRKPS